MVLKPGRRRPLRALSVSEPPRVETSDAPALRRAPATGSRDPYVGISESLLVAPRIPRAAKTPELDLPGFRPSGDSNRAGPTQGAPSHATSSKLASPLALLIGISLGFVVSWVVGLL